MPAREYVVSFNKNAIWLFKLEKWSFSFYDDIRTGRRTVFLRLSIVLRSMTPFSTMEATDEKTLDVRPIPPKDKHPTIFETFDELAPGEDFVLVNDHDPKPLYYQFEAERPGEMDWEYLEEGPEVWKVRITKTEEQ